MLTPKKLQEEQRPWVKHNFGGRRAWYPLLGLMEELGEIAHAFLKREQGIRGTEAEHLEAIKDGVGDVVIFLADFCSANDLDFQECVEVTWAKVKQRDWKANPLNGEKDIQ